MSLVVRKLPLAEQDALDAAIWYEQRRPGLGEEFLHEVDRAVRALGESALHHRIRFADVRRTPIPEGTVGQRDEGRTNGRIARRSHAA